MLNKKTLNLDQLKSLSKSEIIAYRKEAEARKAELIALKNKKNITEEQQEELDEIVIFLVDVDDIINEKTSYKPSPGTENAVHLILVYGRRYSPLTGKEVSEAFTQIFTFAEWQLFKKNYKGLGYTIMAVLHDPYGDAAQFVTKN